MVVETSISRPQFHFGFLVGLGTVNITCGKLPAYCALGTGTGPACLRALEEADGR